MYWAISSASVSSETSHSNFQRKPGLLRVRTCQRILICISCFIVATAYRMDADASTTSVQIFVRKNHLVFWVWHEHCWGAPLFVSPSVSTTYVRWGPIARVMPSADWHVSCFLFNWTIYLQIWAIIEQIGIKLIQIWIIFIQIWTILIQIWTIYIQIGIYILFQFIYLTSSISYMNAQFEYPLFTFLTRIDSEHICSTTNHSSSNRTKQLTFICIYILNRQFKIIIIELRL